jgi:hypothetical protein|tara:strand:- start:341 stop:697 length:357 start_codon:yes stop_codon:yes gene_type:complete
MNWEVLQKLNTETVKFFNPIPENVVGIGTTYDHLKYVEGYEKPPKEAFEAKLQELIDAQPLVELRAERTKRLTECDYLAMSDYPHADYEMKIKWLQYRQALRDLPSSADPQWPVAPSQ